MNVGSPVAKKSSPVTSDQEICANAGRDSSASFDDVLEIELPHPRDTSMIDDRRPGREKKAPGAIAGCLRLCGACFGYR